MSTTSNAIIMTRRRARGAKIKLSIANLSARQTFSIAALGFFCFVIGIALAYQKTSLLRYLAGPAISLGIDLIFWPSSHKFYEKFIGLVEKYGQAAARQHSRQAITMRREPRTEYRNRKEERAKELRGSAEGSWNYHGGRKKRYAGKHAKLR